MATAATSASTENYRINFAQKAGGLSVEKEMKK